MRNSICLILHSQVFFVLIIVNYHKEWQTFDTFLFNSIMLHLMFAFQTFKFDNLWIKIFLYKLKERHTCRSWLKLQPQCCAQFGLGVTKLAHLFGFNQYSEQLVHITFSIVFEYQLIRSKTLAHVCHYLKWHCFKINGMNQCY